MNFVLHWHVARRELGSGLAGAAATLPDLWRMADRSLRARRGALAEPADPELREVLTGIEHHLEVDRWFHAAAVFVEGERRVASRLKEAAIEAPKIGLFAHVLWEMLLDGALLRRDGLEATLASMRPDLEQLAVHSARAAELHAPVGLDAAAREGRARTLARMDQILEAVREGPWLAGYRDGAGVTARLDGVRRRLGLPALDATARARATEALEALGADADKALAEARFRAA